MTKLYDHAAPVGQQAQAMQHAPALAQVPGAAARCNPTELDECRVLEILTEAVDTLRAAPRDPQVDTLVHDLRVLAQACRRHALAVHTMAHTHQPDEAAARMLVRAELLAAKAEEVAVLARRLALGGDPGVLDHWLARQPWAAPGTRRRPGHGAASGGAGADER